MEKKNQNEELQSRREFFKKAAKVTLPILGTIVLAGAPVLVKATVPMGCAKNSCYVQCADTCRSYCNGTCTITCKNTCRAYCNRASR